MTIPFPITVDGIDLEEEGSAIDPSGLGNTCGDMVEIRPVAPEYENKTFLGMYLGEVTLGVNVVAVRPDASEELKPGESCRLKVGFSRKNPAFYIPDIDKVIYGAESWWGIIDSEDQLRQITDERIQNIWYVKALKQISDQNKAKAAKEG